MANSRVRSIATQQTDEALGAIEQFVRRGDDVFLAVLDPDLVRREPDDGLVGGNSSGTVSERRRVFLVAEKEEATGTTA